MAADLFDSNPSLRVPQDADPIYQGASVIRALKTSLQTYLSKFLDNSGNFQLGTVPGSILQNQSVKAAQHADQSTPGIAQTDLIQGKHLANGTLQVDQIDMTSGNKLFGNGFLQTGKTLTPRVDSKTMDLNTQVGQAFVSLMIKNAGVGFNEVSQGIARIWCGSFTGKQGTDVMGNDVGTHANFIFMPVTQYGRGGSGTVGYMQPDFIVVTRDGYSDTFIAFSAEKDSHYISPMHAVWNGGGTAIAGTNLNAVYWGVNGVGFCNTSSANFNGWSGSTGFTHYMLALGF